MPPEYAIHFAMFCLSDAFGGDHESQKEAMDLIRSIAKTDTFAPFADGWKNFIEWYAD